MCPKTNNFRSQQKILLQTAPAPPQSAPPLYSFAPKQRFHYISYFLVPQITEFVFQLVDDATNEHVGERTTNGEGVFSFCSDDRIFVIVSLFDFLPQLSFQVIFTTKNCSAPQQREYYTQFTFLSFLILLRKLFCTNQPF